MQVGRAALTASAATGATAIVTGANRLGVLPVSTLASSPHAVGDGRLWLLLTSGLLADRPAVASLAGFWVVGFVVLLVLSARAAAGVAVAGHTLSALGIYGAIALARLVDGHTFASVMRVLDYGLSAMIAAWIGAIAHVFWARHPTRAAHLLVVLGSAGCAGIGLAVKPGVTLLDSEHLLAYAVGVALADAALRERLVRPFRRLAAARARVPTGVQPTRS